MAPARRMVTGVRLSQPLFVLCVATGVGAAATLMLAMLAAQAGYAGLRAPLAALAEPDIQHAIRLSMFCATIAAGLAMIVAIPAAFALARYRFPGRMAVDVLLDIPIIISPVAIGMTLLLMFRTAPGSWVQENLIQFVFEVPGIILAQFVIALALQVRVLKASFEEINPRLEQVARYLGCGPWAAMWRVTLPLARPGLVAALVLGWGRAVGDYGATVTIAGSVRGKTDTIPVSIMLNWSAVRIEAAVALVMVLTVIALLVLFTVRLAAGGRRT